MRRRQLIQAVIGATLGSATRRAGHRRQDAARTFDEECSGRNPRSPDSLERRAETALHHRNRSRGGPFDNCTVAYPHMGVIGFDVDLPSRGSGSRMSGHLVNAPGKPIGANSKRTDFALAA